MAMTRLREKYEKEVLPVVMGECNLKSMMAVPRLKKIVVNMGTSDLLKDRDRKEKLMGDLAAITGQKPAVRPAKVSVAGFGIREGNPVGLVVTLRGERMYDFMDRLISIVLPRLRDFRGVPTKSFDEQGNYTLGMTEYSVFPEIDISKVDRAHGLEITFVINAGDKDVSRRLLELMGIPFMKGE
jgi:large subunit ribosomal protein L5